jgi:HAE1 family hydrophobic/amphiphilic exporter-1
MRGQNLRRVRSTQGEVDVLVGFQEGDRETIDQLMQLPITRRGDETITLAAIAGFELKKGPVRINREDRQTSIAVLATLDGITMDDARKKMQPVLDQIHYPPGYGWSYGSSFRNSEDAMNQMVVNIFLALALIYLVMASLFESTLYPISIITCIAFAVIGVFWFFMFTNTTFDLMAMIGILILMGVVVNNGIVLVDHINQLRSEGMARNEAIITGGMNRMRPILMTAGTTVLGLLPLCIGNTQIGGDGPPYFPMARAIVGGLLFATVISMVVLPTFYIWLDNLRNWTSRVFGDVKVVPHL